MGERGRSLSTHSLQNIYRSHVSLSHLFTGLQWHTMVFILKVQMLPEYSRARAQSSHQAHRQSSTCHRDSRPNRRLHRRDPPGFGAASTGDSPKQKAGLGSLWYDFTQCVAIICRVGMIKLSPRSYFLDTRLKMNTVCNYFCISHLPDPLAK